MRQAIIVFIISLFSIPCTSQTYKEKFNSLEEADIFFKQVNAKHEQGIYEENLPQLLVYKDYYKNHLPDEINIFANVCQFIGHAYYYTGNAKEAEAVYNESLESLREYGDLVVNFIIS